MNHNEPLGETLRVFRARHRLTQQKLATMLDVHPQTLSQWERGYPCRSPRMLRALLHALECEQDQQSLIDPLPD